MSALPNCTRAPRTDPICTCSYIATNYILHHKPSLEPEQTQHSTDTDIILEYIRNRHPCIEQLLSSLITDAGEEGSWFADQSKLLGPLVVHGDGRRLHLWLGHYQTLTNQLAVYLTVCMGRGEGEGRE